MKKIYIISLLVFLMAGRGFSQTLETFHDFTAVTILGDTISLSQYAGKKLLVVNTASYCGFTPQFDDLQALDSTYDSYNFEVIGFPCNDFGGQDPHNDSTILGFCQGIYGVTFQMMSKISITAPDTAEFYKWLQLQSRNGVANAPVTWNFNKFCIDENGQWVRHFPQYTLPFDTAITNWITSGTSLNITEHSRIPVMKINNVPVRDNLSLTITAAEPMQGKVDLLSPDGKCIQTLFDGEMNKSHSITYNTAQLQAGIYFVRLQAGRYATTSKVAVLGY